MSQQVGKCKDLSKFPTLSNQERDWRWNRIREMMAKNNVDVLLVLPLSGEALDQYFTNDSPGAVVIFPLEGEPTAIFSMGVTWAGAWLMAEERGENAWVKDWRFHPKSVVDVLKEKGFDTKRIGTLGVTDGPYVGPGLSHTMWQQFHESLPNANWVPLMKEFLPLWLTKSQEDIALFRHAAVICEAVCEVAVETAKPGVNELELYAKMMNEIQRNGATTPFGIIMHSGPKGNVGHYMPKWLHRAQERRTLQWGDKIHIELGLNAAAAHAQSQLCMVLGEADEVTLKAAALARESYEICLKELKPGVRFGDLVEAMRVPNKREGAWQLTPLIHSMNPLHCVDQPTRGIENMTGLTERYQDFFENTIHGADFVLKPGMTFQPEPNAAFGRTYVDIGGNILLTENGCEELNIIPTRMQIVK